VSNKKGFVPVLLVIIVLAVSSAIVFYVIRNQQKAKAADTTYPTPGGQIHINPTSAPSNGSVTLTATDVHGANGATVDNVRYYLLNPYPFPYSWGQPDWCSAYTTYMNLTNGPTSGGSSNSCNFEGIYTYDISQSSNPADNYAITWNSSTHSSGSTPYSRALTPTNIYPGKYKIGLRVEDVNGVVSGGASEATITITSGALQSPTPTPSLFGLSVSPTSVNLTIPSGGRVKALDLKNLKNQVGGFTFYGYPTSKGPGIQTIPATGGLQPNGTIPVDIEVINTSPGTYTGTQVLKDPNGTGQINIPVTITVPPLTTDSDSDGFNNGVEAFSGTNPLKACGINAWPPDFNNDKVVNSIDQDLLVQHHYINTPNYDKRYDLNSDKKINSTDQLIEAKQLGKTCS